MEKKVIRLQAKIHALENAAEFIRGHHEGGGIDDETFGFPLEIYIKESLKLYNRLSKEAGKLNAKLYTLTTPTR
jgi:hypothetical protein